MWFSATLLFVEKNPSQPHRDVLWEERIILLQAANELTAKAKAEKHGMAAEHEYHNVENRLVKWRFERVERIYHIESDALEDGTELFARFLRDSEVRSLLTPFED